MIIDYAEGTSQNYFCVKCICGLCMLPNILFSQTTTVKPQSQSCDPLANVRIVWCSFRVLALQIVTVILPQSRFNL